MDLKGIKTWGSSMIEMMKVVKVAHRLDDLRFFSDLMVSNGVRAVSVDQ